MKIKGAFPIRWAAQDGKPGPPGAPGEPGHDGSTARIIYAESYTMPATPTGSTHAEWSTQPPQQPQIDVSFSGEWSPMDDGSLLAPQPAAGTTTTCTLRIATTEAAQTVHVGVWSMTMAFIYVGNIDKPFSTTDYALQIPPTFVEEEYNAVAITVPKAGVHTLCLGLVEATTPLDGRKVRVRVGNRPVWLSSSLTYDDGGQPLTWTAPTLFREGTRAAYANEKRGNMLRQTAFVTTQMGAWDIAAGDTTDGINGINAFMGTNAPDATDYKDFLQQQIYDPAENGEKAIHPNRWYTLSFYAKTNTEGSKVQSFVYPSCCDMTAGMVVDGVQKGASPSDASVLWTLTGTFVRHVVTFKTKDAIYDKPQYVLFRLPADSKDCITCMPKLEEGTQATEWTTNDADIADTAADRTGFPIDNGLWDKTKEYRWDDTRRDFVNYEFNGTFYKFGVKKKGMTIPAGTPPASAQGDSKWEVAHKIQTLVTDTIFGANANIGGFMASNARLISANKSLTLDGIKGLISLAHADGYVWKVQEDGKQVLGIEGGQRIEFDPSAKEIRIYNDKGTAVANLSGSIYANVEALFGDSADDFTMTAFANGDQRVNGQGQTGLVKNTFTLTIATATTMSAARLTIKEGSLTAKGDLVRTDDTGLMDEQGRYWFPNTASVSLYVKTYADSSKATVIQARRDIANLTSRGDKVIQRLTLDTISVDVLAGYHEVLLEYYVEAIGSDYASAAEVTWSVSRIAYGSDYYLSRLFGNGFAYGSSINNYIAAINENGHMRHRMVSGDCGYDIYNGTIKVMLKSKWYTLSRKSDGTVMLNGTTL